MKIRLVLVPCLFALLAVSAIAQNNPVFVDTTAVSAIRDEALKQSQVMQTLSYLTDVYGPRLTLVAGVQRGGSGGKHGAERMGPPERSLRKLGAAGEGLDIKEIFGSGCFPQSIPSHRISKSVVARHERHGARPGRPAERRIRNRA